MMILMLMMTLDNDDEIDDDVRLGQDLASNLQLSGHAQLGFSALQRSEVPLMSLCLEFQTVARHGQVSVITKMSESQTKAGNQEKFKKLKKLKI